MTHGELAGSNLSRGELLARLEREYEALNRLLDRLTPAQRVANDALGSWSVRDLVAHLIAHERRAVDEVRAALRGERLEIDHSANDAFNAQAVAAFRNRSLADARAAWRASYQAVFELVSNLPDYAFDPTGPLAEALDDTIDGVLANNTYEHYAEHRHELEAWLNRTS